MEHLAPGSVDLLEDWVREQSFFPECLRDQRLEDARRARYDLLRSPNTLKFLGHESAFVVWEPGLLEQDTGQNISRLWAWRGNPDQLVGLLARSSQEFSESVLLIERAVDCRKLDEPLRRSGFFKSRYRLSRTPQVHELDTLRQGQFRLRQGSEFDRAFLCNLATAHVIHTLPPGREEQSRAYSQSILKRFTELDYGPDSSHDLLIAEEAKTRKSVGYILLELEEENSAFLLDIGVRQSHWGQYVAQFLVRATENLLVQHGIDFLHTEISAANRRSFVTACRSLKFQPRVEHWMRT